MHTWAELARALLISSGLPWFLWEEAMKHVEWLKVRSPHHAPDGKTPYEMKHKRKPHIGGIHEVWHSSICQGSKSQKARFVRATWMVHRLWFGVQKFQDLLPT
jgi:hypothetical protein